MQKPKLDQAYLKTLLIYSPGHGKFFWRETRNNYAEQHSEAGHRHGGYIRIKIDKTHYMAHRLAWLYMTGEWPSEEIDHINGIGADNRWENLREASHSQNTRNAKKKSTNSSGVKGVYPKRGKWGTRVAGASLGQYNTLEEAAEAVRAARELLHGEFTNHG